MITALAGDALRTKVSGLRMAEWVEIAHFQPKVTDGDQLAWASAFNLHVEHDMYVVLEGGGAGWNVPWG